MSLWIICSGFLALCLTLSKGKHVYFVLKQHFTNISCFFFQFTSATAKPSTIIIVSCFILLKGGWTILEWYVSFNCFCLRQHEQAFIWIFGQLSINHSCCFSSQNVLASFVIMTFFFIKLTSASFSVTAFICCLQPSPPQNSVNSLISTIIICDLEILNSDFSLDTWNVHPESTMSYVQKISSAGKR